MALDISSKTGWAFFEHETAHPIYGMIPVPVTNFNVNNYPDRQPEYPFNLILSSALLKKQIGFLILKTQPDMIAIENTTKGMNRHTQRMLEFFHKSILEHLIENSKPFKYLDPSEWRKLLDIRMTPEQREHNKRVKSNVATGKITKKHLSVNWANERYGLKLLLVNNDIADAIGIGRAYYEKFKNPLRTT